MRYETISLTVPSADGPAQLTAYAPDNSPETGMSRLRPGIIICPGGGYGIVSEREAEPVALRFLGLGYAAFVLRYHAAPRGRWPIPQRQLLAAVDYVRTNCGDYHVDPKAVLVMGFSAGGHLAACGGTLWNRPEVYRSLKKKALAYRPDGMILCYPVITSGDHAQRTSFQNLLGDRYEELLPLLSLERRVKSSTPPTFIWHTADDTVVDLENTLLFETALRARGCRWSATSTPTGPTASPWRIGPASSRRSCGRSAPPAPGGWPSATPGFRTPLCGEREDIPSSTPPRLGRRTFFSFG